jgi:hypothetical protein
MMRLADFLLRWTGEAQYADYWEKNLLNGVMAQGHWEGRLPSHGLTTPDPTQGLITYFLPLRAGAQKGWASERGHFFCCHGSLVQANATHTGSIWYQSTTGISVAQVIPSQAEWTQAGVPVTASLVTDTQSGYTQAINHAELPSGSPRCWAFTLNVNTESPVSFELSVRLPAWLKGAATVKINGKPVDWSVSDQGWGRLSRIWHADVVHVEFPKGLTAVPLPGEPDLFAFLDGPVLLAGLCDGERTLVGDVRKPETLLTPDNEREWRRWTGQFRTKGQAEGLRFLPLNDIGYERYSVYFRVAKS